MMSRIIIILKIMRVIRMEKRDKIKCALMKIVYRRSRMVKWRYLSQSRNLIKTGNQPFLFSSPFLSSLTCCHLIFFLINSERCTEKDHIINKIFPLKYAERYLARSSFTELVSSYTKNT